MRTICHDPRNLHTDKPPVYHCRMSHGVHQRTCTSTRILQWLPHQAFEIVDVGGGGGGGLYSILMYIS